MLYVPFPSKVAAEDAVKTLLIAKLIACGNVVPSDSMYVWQGIMTTNGEWIAIMKTTLAATDAASLKIAEIHSYEVPAILHWQVHTNEAYGRWVMEQVVDML